jgi:predicted site-specific integrase-resolvase
MAKQPIWIKEKEASEMIGLSPEILRRYSKSGKLDISYTHINNRNFQYDKNSIEKVLLKNAVLIH